MAISRFIVFFALPLIVVGCAGADLSRGNTAIPVLPEQQQLAVPDVVQRGKGAQWVSFVPKTLGVGYSAIVTGPDANVWFIDEGVGLVRMVETGAIKEFELSGEFEFKGVSMTVGADKRFYIGNGSTSIVRVTTSGAATTIPIPSGDTTGFDGMALGPDGNVWFAEFDHIAKITPAGKITEIAYPVGFSTNQYGGVATGSDGNVWFAESSGNAIGRVVPRSGAIKMFRLPVRCTPAPLVLGKDGNLWFACLTTTPLLGRITPSGAIKTYPIGAIFNGNETEQFCTRGPDGEPWCASAVDHTVFRVNTAAQTVTTFSPPLVGLEYPDSIAAGPDGNLWVDTAGGPTAGRIDVLVLSPLTVTPTSLAFSDAGSKQTLTVSESGKTHWTAASSNTAVATVASGATDAKFTVRSVGTGTCTITISDDSGNSAVVKVSVT
jgi:virginiamycin B lyase